MSQTPADKKKMSKLLNSVPFAKGHLKDRLQTEVKPLKEQRKAVTPQQWKFVQELLAGDGKISMRQAAVEAGYTPDKAEATARRLTDPKISPHVVAAIQEYRIELNERYGTTFERHMRDMKEIRDAALEAGNYGAAVSAEYRRGQALGSIYVDRKEIRHGTIDSMSKEEVMRKLQDLKNLYGGPPPKQIIDMTPEELSVKFKPEKTTTLLEESEDESASDRLPDKTRSDSGAYVHPSASPEDGDV
mgnify:CR=1 FL=1